MATVQNTPSYRAAESLAILAGWSAEPNPAYPVHRSLEREAMEMIDQAERDHAARVIYARRGVR